MEIKEGLNAQEAQLIVNRLECSLAIGKDKERIEDSKKAGLELFKSFPELKNCDKLKAAIKKPLQEWESAKLAEEKEIKDLAEAKILLEKKED